MNFHRMQKADVKWVDEGNWEWIEAWQQIGEHSEGDDEADNEWKWKWAVLCITKHASHIMCDGNAMIK